MPLENVPIVSYSRPQWACSLIVVPSILYVLIQVSLTIYEAATINVTQYTLCAF